MSDAIQTLTTTAQWQSYTQPVKLLFSALPVSRGACVLVMLACAPARAMLSEAIEAAGAQMLAVDVGTAQSEVGSIIEQRKPEIVVCAPEVFGWVSKLAFLSECAAIYTCDADGAGTLLDRAAHLAK